MRPLRGFRDLLRDTHGSVTIEYVIAITFVTFVISGALWALGPSLVRMFSIQTAWLALPVP